VEPVSDDDRVVRASVTASDQADRSVVTWVTPARHDWSRTVPLLSPLTAVRLSMWASRPPVPTASTTAVCHRSGATRYWPLTGSCSHVILPRGGLIDAQHAHRRQRRSETLRMSPS